MKTLKHGDIVAFRNKSNGHNYVGIFDKFDIDTFCVSRFLVHRTKEPTLKDNEGEGGSATLWAGHYSKPRILRRKTLP